ncbi:MAG: hypothetical protein ACREM3_26170 [Candidatus Rokuibacteriota bacterium]
MDETGVTTMAARPLPLEVEAALVDGDLSKLSVQQRVVLYRQTCESLGLNSLTKPFMYANLNGKLVLYATRNCADQLRKIHSVRLEITSREMSNGLYVVGVRATLPNGRTDDEVGAVSVAGLKGEALANALMKAITKAKRRATMGIIGLSMLDETEVETVPGAQVFAEPHALAPAGLLEDPLPTPEAPAVDAPPEEQNRRLMAPDATTQKPPDRLSRQEAIFRIQTRLHELVGKSSDASARQEKMDLCEDVFNTPIESWVKVTQLPLATLRQGVSRLEEMGQDVPEFPPPEQNAASSAPMSEESPLELPPHPTIIQGYVSEGDLRTLAIWAEMQGQAEVLDDLLRHCPLEHGRRLMTLSEWGLMVRAVEWSAKHAPA